MGRAPCVKNQWFYYTKKRSATPSKLPLAGPESRPMEALCPRLRRAVSPDPILGARTSAHKPRGPGWGLRLCFFEFLEFLKFLKYFYNAKQSVDDSPLIVLRCKNISNSSKIQKFKKFKSRQPQLGPWDSEPGWLAGWLAG